MAKSERCFFRTRKDSGSRLASRLEFFSRATDNFSTCHEGMTLGVFLPLRTWEVTLRSRGFFTQETTLSGPGGVPRAGLKFWRRHWRRLDGEGYIARSLLPAFAPGYRERGSASFAAIQLARWRVKVSSVEPVGARSKK